MHGSAPQPARVVSDRRRVPLRRTLGVRQLQKLHRVGRGTTTAHQPQNGLRQRGSFPNVVHKPRERTSNATLSHELQASRRGAKNAASRKNLLRAFRARSLATLTGAGSPVLLSPRATATEGVGRSTRRPHLFPEQAHVHAVRGAVLLAGDQAHAQRVVVEQVTLQGVEDQLGEVVDVGPPGIRVAQPQCG